MKRFLTGWSGVAVFALAGVLGALGCGGDAQLELAAADTLFAVADRMELAVGEYHDEIAQLDDGRESAVVDAFIVRVQADHADEAAMASHATAFEAALAKIRADRGVEWQRRAATLDNVGIVREVARGLQKLAIESLTLNDEIERYLSGWVEARRRAQAEADAAASARSGSRLTRSTCGDDEACPLKK